MDSQPAEAAAPSISPAFTQRTGYLLIKLGEVILRLAEQTLQPLNLRARHFNVMSMVAADHSLSQRGISDLLGLDPNIIVAVVDDLERRGLLTRKRSPHDRRRHLLTITREGQRILTDAHHRIEIAERDLLTPLSASEAEHLHELAQRILTPRWPLQRTRT